MPYDTAKAKLHLTEEIEVSDAVKTQSMKELIKGAEAALKDRGWAPSLMDSNVGFEVSDTIYVLSLEPPFGLKLDGELLPLRYNTDRKMFTVTDKDGEVDGLVWVCRRINQLGK